MEGRGVAATLAHIYRREGVRGLFKWVPLIQFACTYNTTTISERLACRGNGASVLRIVPYAAFNFGAYEQFRQLLTESVYPAGTPHTGLAS